MTVAIVKAKPSYKNINNMKDALVRAFDLCEYTPEKETILLKPNVGSQHGSIKKGDYVAGSLCGAIAEIFRDRQVIVAEGVATGMDYELSMKNYGYYELEKKYDNVKLLNLEEETERIEFDWKYGKLKLPKIVFDCEYINLAKYKTHYFTHISMLMKNQKGILPVVTKKRFHRIDLQDAIYELSKILYPDFNILDGLIAIDGNGPNSIKPIGGKTRKLGLFICGRDIHETERVGIEVAQLDISKTHAPDVPFEVVGEKIEDVTFPFDPPTIGQQYKMMNFNMQLISSCSGCMQSFIGAADLMMKRNPFSLKTMKSNIDFFRYGVINPLILYFGPGVKLVEGTDKEKSKMVCVGVCTKKLAKEEDLPYIKGCPPTSEELMQYMLPRKEVYEKLRIRDNDPKEEGEEI